MAGQKRVKVVEPGISIRRWPVVLTTGLAKTLVASSSFIALARNCSCRDRRHCPGYPQDFGCIYLGEGARGIVSRGNATEVSAEEAIDHVLAAREMGLVHMAIWSSAELRGLGADASRALELCACCPCCCIPHRIDSDNRAVLDGVIGLGLARAIKDSCSHCGTCVTSCPFHALKISEDGPVVDGERCKGCGRCESACQEGMLEIEDRQTLPLTVNEYSSDAYDYFDRIRSVVR
jgi:ferredoxin